MRSLLADAATLDGRRVAARVRRVRRRAGADYFEYASRDGTCVCREISAEECAVLVRSSGVR